MCALWRTLNRSVYVFYILVPLLKIYETTEALKFIKVKVVPSKSCSRRSFLNIYGKIMP